MATPTQRERALAELEALRQFIPAEPERESTEGLMLGRPGEADVQADPNYAAAQMEALAMLGGRTSGGADVRDGLAMRRAVNSAGAQDRAFRGNVAGAMEQRGMRGGADLAAILGGINASGTQLAGDERAVQAAAMQRQMDAINSLSGLASQGRSQSFDEAKRRAAAADAATRGNALYARDVAGRNVDRTNSNDQSRFERSFQLGATKANVQQNMSAQANADRAEDDARRAQRTAGAIEAGAAGGRLLGSAVEDEDDD
jgi:hypothetical protein